MKKIFTLIGIFALVLTSCEGDQGPQGPPGFDGEDGVNIVGTTYEVDNVNFSATNDFYRFQFPSGSALVDSDAVLVYRLESVTDGLDVWEPLPTATIFYEDGGFLQYRFNYTVGDVDIILESDDISLLDAEFTSNQVFRIVVVPSDFAEDFNGKTPSLEALMSALNISDQDFKKLN